jgi:hypothetical protein
LADYAPVLPGATLTFRAGLAVAARDPVELCGPMEVCRAHGGVYVGVAGHDAAALDLVTVFVAEIVHEGPVLGGAQWGDPLTAAPAVPYQVVRSAAVPGTPPAGVALSSAGHGQPLRWIGRGSALPGIPGLPGRPGGAGGGLWFGTAGEFIPALSPVVMYGVGNISRPPALSSASLVIGINDRDTAAGQIAVVHLAGPLMLGVAAGGVTNGFLLVARGPGQLAAAQPADYDDPADRRVIGVALQNVAAGQPLFWVARH